MQIRVSSDPPQWLSADASSAMIAMVVLSTLITGPAVAMVVRRERKSLKFCSKAIESLTVESELRLLACVHGVQDLPAMLSLVELASGSDKAAIAAYVMQLVELTAKTTTTALYHQQEDDDEEEDEGGADQARQINAGVDVFTMETGITVRQVTAVSSFANMHEDIINGAEDVRASIILLPFHKFQRIDGRMVIKKEAIQSVNRKTLSQSPCSVAIFVDRNFNLVSTEGRHVMVLFFGGPDDREALALGGRLAMNPTVSLSVLRFRPTYLDSYQAEVETEAARGEEVLMAINNHEKESEADEIFLSNFYTRFVVSGMVSFVEKKVKNSLETLDVLKGMDSRYTLFVVGRGSQRLSPFLMGLNDWEECPELGPVGDLLSSSDFSVHGSVLVVQQNIGSSKSNHDEEDEFAIF
ncbi:cation/H(+) antiporter 1-like [Wolffia australiana]